jgi:hypothetical protein
MPTSRMTWLAAGGAVAGILLVVAFGSAARGCRTTGRVGALEQRVGRIETALGIGDAGALPSADTPAPTAADGGMAATAAEDTPPECAVAKVTAYHAWQDALAKAKALAGPAQAACADMWSDKKKQACYYVASSEIRATQAARDSVITGGPAARDAVKNVKDDAKNDVIARARAASEKAFAACGDDAP